MLPRMTGRQRYRANALIKRLCANYDDGNCLLLDDGEPCVCVQSISYSLLCKYFKTAVLPAEPLLEAEIYGSNRVAICKSCKSPYVQNHHNQFYCERCGKIRHRQAKARCASRLRDKNRQSKVEKAL